MTTQEKISAISTDLDKQIRLTQDSLEETTHTLALMKSDADTYNQGWNYLAAVSAISYFLSELKSIIKSGDNKKAENFIRFNHYQIEQFTDKDTLNADEPNESLVDGVKITVYHIFKSYVEILDAE